MLFNQNICIENKEVSKQSKCFIIAEAGVNHNGNLETAKELIDKAVEGGADAVKFQTFKTENIIIKNIEKAPYQKITTSSEESQYEMLKKLELDKDDYRKLKDYATEKNIIFLSTPFDEESLEEVCALNIPAIKIAATDLTNIKFLRQAAQKEKPIILSAGMCYMEEVKQALEAIYPFNKNVILLQCTANYPILDEEANLSVIKTFQENYSILVGYSDHSVGIGAAPYAAAMGAKVIEKHFTLDRYGVGPDHKASLLPEELKELVNSIRKVECYLGSNVKEPTLSEMETRKSLQKCLVANCDIKRGEKFSAVNVTAKRTNGTGMPANSYDTIIGKAAEKDYWVDDIISELD